LSSEATKEVRVIEIDIQTSRKLEAVDITDAIVALPHPGSLAWVGCPHTTAGLILCEADEEMLSDIEHVAAGLLAPFEPFAHHKNNNPNAAAHLMSSLLGAQLMVPCRDGSLDLGTYQRIVFVELDGPRSRSVRVAHVAAIDDVEEGTL
jgi:secondary thiamine-phosphate synthase enzyme